jgi:hypothetical protein
MAFCMDAIHPRLGWSFCRPTPQTRGIVKTYGSVSRDLLPTAWFLVGGVDEGAFLERCAGADERDELGR